MGVNLVNVATIQLTRLRDAAGMGDNGHLLVNGLRKMGNALCLVVNV